MCQARTMKQPTLFDTTPAVGDVLFQLYRTTGYRMRRVVVVEILDNGNFVCSPQRHTGTSRFELDSSLVKPVPEKATRK